MAFSPCLVSWAWKTQPSQAPFCSLQPPARRPDQSLAQVSRLWISDVRTSRSDMPGGPKRNKQAPFLPPRLQEGPCHSPRGALPEPAGHSSPSPPETRSVLKQCQVWSGVPVICPPPLGTGPPATGGQQLAPGIPDLVLFPKPITLLSPREKLSSILASEDGSGSSPSSQPALPACHPIQSTQDGSGCPAPSLHNSSRIRCALCRTLLGQRPPNGMLKS